MLRSDGVDAVAWQESKLTWILWQGQARQTGRHVFYREIVFLARLAQQNAAVVHVADRLETVANELVLLLIGLVRVLQKSVGWCPNVGDVRDDLRRLDGAG